MFKSIVLAFSFLTQIPLKISEVKERELIFALSFFPLVGLFEGLWLNLVAYINCFFLSPELNSLLCIIALTLVRGIFHWDGFSDTVDALCIKSCGDYVKDVEKRLQVMKDSTVGVGGVVALIINFLLRFILLKEVIINSFFPFVLILSSVLSKGLIVPIIYLSKPAKKEGIGAFLISFVTFREVLLALTFTFLIILVCVFLFSLSYHQVFFLIFSIFLIFLLGFWIKKFLEKRFLGLTGDNFGALMEFFEISFLFFWGTLWLKL